MKKKHLVNVILVIAGLIGMLTAPPASITAQSTFDCATVTEIPQTECQALVALYNATNGNGWYVTENVWLDTTTPCSWHGVTCEANHVTRLDLSYKGLNGIMPAEIGNLSALIYLDMSDNSSGDEDWGGLLGAIPPEIGNLSNLTVLNLYHNQLTSVPAEIGNLSNLTQLVLHWNKLVELPAEIGQLSQLTYLSASGQLTTLPPEIGNLTNLTTLSLALNRNLDSLPSELENLTHLTTLDLSRNYVKSLPPVIFKLSSLTTLDLGRNRLDFLPPEIGALTHLTTLDIGGNNITALPSEFFDLSKLTSLNLGKLPLTSYPPELAELTNLTTLDLSANDLTALPMVVCNMTGLTTLDLGRNELTSLPPEIGNLTRLTDLDLYDNPLRGAIPAFMARLTSLSNFNFESTQWCVPTAGPIPAWLANIAHVKGTDQVCAALVTLNIDPAPEMYAHIGASFTAAVLPSDADAPIAFTWNTGVAAPISHVRENPADAAWLYWDTPGEYTLTVAAANEYNAITATQTILVHPISSTIVLPDAPARLVYTNTQGLPTTLDLPAGSAALTETLVYLPGPVPAPIPEWRPANHNFTLDFYREGRQAPRLAFPAPISLTLHYSAADIAGIDRPANLQLMRRDAAGWQPAACGPVAHDLEQRVIAMPLCQLGEFALFGPATLTKAVEPATSVKNGETLTYTLVFSDPEGSTLRLFDPISPTLAWQGFVGAPPAGITFTGGALSGTLTLSPTHPLTLSFTVRAQLPKTAFTAGHAAVANTAYSCPTDTACIFRPSNTVSSDITIPYTLFLPLILR